MPELPAVVEWCGDTAILLRATNMGRGRVSGHVDQKNDGVDFFERAGRPIEKIIVHSTGSARKNGIEACSHMIQRFTAEPVYRSFLGKIVRVGGGLGWPGVPYTFVVPYRPQVHEGRLAVYRLWDDSWVTWHTGDHSRRSVSVAVSGHFRSRHDRARVPHIDPLELAVQALTDLVDNYLLPRFGLSCTDVYGHFDLGKPACPGDALEAWIRTRRGEEVGWWPPKSGNAMAAAPRSSGARIAALLEIGFDNHDGVDRDDWMRMAIEAFQSARGLVVDGIWGPHTEAEVRRVLSPGGQPSASSMSRSLE